MHQEYEKGIMHTDIISNFINYESLKLYSCVTLAAADADIGPWLARIPTSILKQYRQLQTAEQIFSTIFKLDIKKFNYWHTLL